MSARAFVIAATATAVLVTDAAAQSPSPDGRAFGIEAEVLFGRTFVDAPRWAQFNGLNEENKQMAGAIARVFFVYLGQVRTGVEIGGQQLFAYEVETIGFSGPERRKVHVDPIHFAIAGRAMPSPRIDLDFGFGFYYSEDAALPGVHFGASYRVFNGKRVAIPIGVRVAAVLEAEVSAKPVALKAGVTWK